MKIKIPQLKCLHYLKGTILLDNANQKGLVLNKHSVIWIRNYKDLSKEMIKAIGLTCTDDCHLYGKIIGHKSINPWVLSEKEWKTIAEGLLNL